MEEHIEERSDSDVLLNDARGRRRETKAGVEAKDLEVVHIRKE